MKHNAVHGRMFTAQECQRLIHMADRLPKELGTIADHGEIDSGIRACHVSWIERSNRDFAWVFERTDAWIERGNEMAFNADVARDGARSLQYTVYTVGAHYKIHMDTHLSEGAETMRKVSFSTLLNWPVEFDGGALYLHGELVEALSEPGMAVGFPAISQHEVQPVTRGMRISLVGWYEGPPWK